MGSGQPTGDGDLQFSWRLSGNTLTISGANTDFDFNADDIDEPAKVGAILVRQ
jgi:hypothetical protein